MMKLDSVLWEEVKNLKIKKKKRKSEHGDMLKTNDGLFSLWWWPGHA